MQKEHAANNDAAQKVGKAFTRIRRGVKNALMPASQKAFLELKKVPNSTRTDLSTNTLYS